jgi:hypothetical protein
MKAQQHFHQTHAQEVMQLQQLGSCWNAAVRAGSTGQNKNGLGQ